MSSKRFATSPLGFLADTVASWFCLGRFSSTPFLKMTALDSGLYVFNFSWQWFSNVKCFQFPFIFFGCKDFQILKIR